MAFEHQHWIDGKSTESSESNRFEVLNPENDSVLGTAARGTDADINHAVQVAQKAFQSFQKTTPQQRETWLLRAAELLQQEASDFVGLIIQETGSPISKARREVTTAIGTLTAAAGAVRRLTGKTIPSDVAGRMSVSVRRPLGVVAGITPFNVPLIKGIKHTAMPLATGNSVVLLPSAEAPITSLRMAKLYADAGIPAGAMNVVTGMGCEIGDTLTAHPNVQMVGFTGSTIVGRHIARRCAASGKRVLLEMGGKGSVIVMDDADMSSAVQAAVVGAFLFQGQICMATSRIFVQRNMYEKFLAAFIAATQSLTLGDLHEPKTMLGPIINAKQRDRVRRHLSDACEKGAVVQTGGQWENHRCQPTILTDVTADCLVFAEETFGPVVSVYPFDTATEAVQMSNDSPFGLSASVFTSNLTQAMAMAEEIRAGMVHVNAGTIQEDPMAPFGGVGDSGFGRESCDSDIAEMTQWKWITFQ